VFVNGNPSGQNTVSGASLAFGAIVSCDCAAQLPCVDKGDCADTNVPNGIRDDNCVFWECIGGVCVGPTDQIYGDIGGPGGSCMRDGSPDANDGFHVLNCFANSNFGMPGPYQCDDALLPINADIGGAGLDCCCDGACDANDRFLVLQSFAAGGGPAGPNMCVCPTNPISPGHSCPPPNATGPRNYDPQITDTASVSAVASQRTAQAGDLVKVDVFIDTALSGLQGYQLHLGTSGGRRGSLELVDVSIAGRADHVYAEIPHWDAYNVQTHQMMAGLDSAAVATPSKGYLATFTYRVSPDASGTFVVDVLGYQPSKSDQRTFLFGPGGGMIALQQTHPAVIVVTGGASRGLR
jgi:hypothetical protein